MDIMIYLTERCNLQCKYCETVEDRSKFTLDPSYSMETLKSFLNKVPNLTIHFYGGEPMLNIQMLKFILDNIKYNYATLQTNGFNINEIELKYLNKIRVISFSIDGRKEQNDLWRGKGAYDSVLVQAKKLREHGFKGEINARMTVSPGLDIEKEVKHLLSLGLFDKIHWQLNALFNGNEWKENKEDIIKWFREDYNLKLLSLIDMFADEINKNNKVLQIVPFTGVLYSFLSKKPVNNVRCGAGHEFWAIATNGEIFPCPVMRNFPEFSLGNISKITPQDLNPKCMLTEKCTSCYLFSLCGGRCLNANLRNEWDEEGFKLVCSSVYALIFGLANHVDMIREKIKQGKISINDFENFHDYEVMP